MLDLQFKMLENIYLGDNSKSEKISNDNYGVSLDQIKNWLNISNIGAYLPYSQIIDRLLLGEYSFGISDELIKNYFEDLLNGGFIKLIDNPINSVLGGIYYQCTDRGAKLYLKNKEEREFIKNKLELEIELLKSNKEVNSYQKWIVASIVTTAILTAVNLYLTNRQLSIAKIQLQVEQQKLLPNTQADSLKLIPKIPVHQTLSQTKP